MLEFIKMFGLGILYTILLPLIVAVFGLFLVYVFFNYLVMESKTLFGFFFGYTFTTDTDLEIKLMMMKEEEEKKEVSYQYEGIREDLEDASYENGGEE